MNVHANEDTLLVTSEATTTAISINETFWGFIVRKGGTAPRLAAFGEITAMLACILFGFAAYSQWLLPGIVNNVDMFLFKISGTIVCFVFAFLNYSIARKGLLYETQIDVKKQVVRLARRNRDGVSTLLGSFDFSDIGRIYMQRSKSSQAPNRLYIEPKSKSRALLVATGPARELEPLRERLISELRPAAAPQQTATIVPIRVKPNVPVQKPSVRSAFAVQS